MRIKSPFFEYNMQNNTIIVIENENNTEGLIISLS